MAGYGIDRWRNSNAATNSSIQVLASGYKVTNTSASAAGTINQFLGVDLSGMEVTASMLFSDGTLLFGTGVFPAEGETNVILIARQNHLAGCMLEHHSNTEPAFTITSNPASNFTLKAVKLELGDTQTLAHQEGNTWVFNELPDYGEQLAKCQRYFERIKNAYSHFGTGFANTATNALMYLPIKEKVKTPTVTLSGTIYIWQPGRIGNSAATCTSITDYNMTNGKNMLYFTLPTSGLTLSAPCGMQFRDSTSYIDVSAE